MEIKNKKAYFDYTEVESYVAGIVLLGTEIKSIRSGKASLSDAYCYISGGEIFMKNSYVAVYENAGYVSHEERRDRKLLLHKNEINKLDKKVKEKGFSIVPIKMFIDEHGRCKVSVMLCRGKKEYDKKQTIKERDLDRETKKEI